MKKYLFTIGFAFLVPAVMAADRTNSDREDAAPPSALAIKSETAPVGENNAVQAGSIAAASSTSDSLAALASLPTEVTLPVPNRDLPPTISSRSELANLTGNPGNYESRGGLPFGFLSQPALKETAVEGQIQTLAAYYNDSREHNAALMRQLEVANESLKGVHSLHRALQAAQEERDKEAAARKALEDRLRAVEARAGFLKAKEEKLLLEADRKDAVMVLETARKEFLERENLLLKEIIAELTANAKKVEALFAENSDYERMLQTPAGDSADIEATRQSIRVVVEENARRIRELQEKNRALATQERETKDKISKLEKAIEANDFYTMMLKKINDQNVSDEDLALFIWSIRTTLGMDLDQLSQNRDKRLIEALIAVSRPYEQRPSYGATCSYTGCFRTLGNQFVPGGLAWAGSPINLRDCTYAGSRFAQSASQVASYAKQQLNRK